MAVVMQQQLQHGTPVATWQAVKWHQQRLSCSSNCQLEERSVFLQQLKVTKGGVRLQCSAAASVTAWWCCADEVSEGESKIDIELWDYKFRNHCLVSYVFFGCLFCVGASHTLLWCVTYHAWCVTCPVWTGALVTQTVQQSILCGCYTSR